MIRLREETPVMCATEGGQHRKKRVINIPQMEKCMELISKAHSPDLVTSSREYSFKMGVGRTTQPLADFEKVRPGYVKSLTFEVLSENSHFAGTATPFENGRGKMTFHLTYSLASVRPMAPLEHNRYDYHAILTQVFAVEQGSPEESAQLPQAGADSEPLEQCKGRKEEQRF
ncbi:hypothetical protein STEG23_004197 [Scotinomys teguina]